MWILNTFNSLAILASALNETFGTNLIIPSIVITAKPIMTPNTVLQLANPPRNDPNGTPIMTAMVRPACTNAIACGFFAEEQLQLLRSYIRQRMVRALLLTLILIIIIR